MINRTHDRTAGAAVTAVLIGVLAAQTITGSPHHAISAIAVPATAEFAAMLPLTLELSDTWGQAKSGRLPHPVAVDGMARTTKPVPGGIYYWPETAAIAVYYDDLGQSVPPPGLVQLGVIGTGMDQLTGAGSQVEVHLNSPS